MPVQIRRADLYDYVINALSRDVGAFKQALDKHASTVGVPAPTAVHGLVDALARSADGSFVVEEDVAEAAEKSKGPPVNQTDIDMLMQRIVGLEGRTPLDGQFAALSARVVELEGAAMVFKQRLDSLQNSGR